MQPFRQSSLVQQPDGEIIRAIVDAGSLSAADFGIQFDLGMLGHKVAQEETDAQVPLTSEAPDERLPGWYQYVTTPQVCCLIGIVISGTTK